MISPQKGFAISVFGKRFCCDFELSWIGNSICIRIHRIFYDSKIWKWFCFFPLCSSSFMISKSFKFPNYKHHSQYFIIKSICCSISILMWFLTSIKIGLKYDKNELPTYEYETKDYKLIYPQPINVDDPVIIIALLLVVQFWAQMLSLTQDCAVTVQKRPRNLSLGLATQTPFLHLVPSSQSPLIPWDKS